MTAPKQRWDPDRYARSAGFVPALGMPVLELLAPAPGERVLDLGCGDGALTAKLVEAGCQVVGVDGSAEQIAAARAKGFDARVADGQTLGFEEEFDAVFSNAALHWMKDPAAVIDGVWRALKPGGRFVGEMGGAENVASVRQALHAALRALGHDPDALDPWFFPSEEEYHALLEARGFDVLHIERFRRPTPLPGPLEDWLDTFGESFLLVLSTADRAKVRAQIAAALRPRLYKSGEGWSVDYVRLRFVARKPLRD